MKKAPYDSLFPEKSDKKTIAKLKPLVKQCVKELNVIQSRFHYPSLYLRHAPQVLLAEVLIDFALDIHTGSGLWAALEKCNTELFGTPLPLVQPVNVPLPSGICAERVQFLLWNLYPQIEYDHILSHRHINLLSMSEEMTKFLNGLLPSLPAVSPIKEFLDKPNDYGWEVKKKLIWLGMHSYLFRLLFDKYLEERNDDEDARESPISLIDDFICQHTTPWSGLGVIDILAARLDVPEEQKDELRSWYLRHVSIYKIVETDEEFAVATNLINDTSYRIREGTSSNPRTHHFRPNMIIHGGLVPWRGEWYWSGTQYDLTQYRANEIAEIVKRFKQNTQIVARYWKERDEAVRQIAEEHYQDSQKFYKNNFVMFPNGRAWERAETQRLAAYAKARGFMGQMPNMSLADKLRDCKNGIALYLDPVEGQEIMEEFNYVLSGLKKKGKNFTEYEETFLREWIESSAISPAFVHRVLKEYGGEESIKHAFRLETDESYCLGYLLRCQKGMYYRRRFPCVSIVDTNKD